MVILNSVAIRGVVIGSYVKSVALSTIVRLQYIEKICEV